MIVDPEGAEISPQHKDTWYGATRGTGINIPTAAAAILAVDRSGSGYRFTEERINAGDSLYALGQLKGLGSLLPASTVDEEVRALLHAWKTDQARLKERFDLNRDNRIDEMEWRLARRQARRETRKARMRPESNPVDGINLLTATGMCERPFLLSAFPQTRLASRYKGHALLFLVGR